MDEKHLTEEERRNALRVHLRLIDKKSGVLNTSKKFNDGWSNISYNRYRQEAIIVFLVGNYRESNDKGEAL